LISILIIGNEILSGQVDNTNLSYAIERLSLAGYRVQEVRVVEDQMADIRDAVSSLSARSRYVVSSGGLGPTHDDVTLSAFAMAFEAKMVVHPDLEQRLIDFFGGTLTQSQHSMALVPEGSELVYPRPDQWPLLMVRNCFAFPGMPEFFRKKIDLLVEYLPKLQPLYYAEVLTRSWETEFATELAAIQARHHSVELGSYPKLKRDPYATKITIKSRQVESIQPCLRDLIAVFEALDSLVQVLEPEPFQPHAYRFGRRSDGRRSDGRRSDGRGAAGEV